MCGCNNSELLWFIILFLLLFCCGGAGRSGNNCPGTYGNAGYNNGCGC